MVNFLTVTLEYVKSKWYLYFYYMKAYQVLAGKKDVVALF